MPRLQSNWSNVGPVTLTAACGKEREFSGLAEAYEWLRMPRLKAIIDNGNDPAGLSGGEIRLSVSYWFGSVYGPMTRYAILDELGLAVPVWLLLHEVRRLGLDLDDPGSGRARKRRPVTGAKPARWEGLRSVRTRQEIAASCQVEVDEDAKCCGIRVRGKRKVSALPTAYDDISRAHVKRNWKAYRRHQWRDTPPGIVTSGDMK